VAHARNRRRRENMARCMWARWSAKDVSGGAVDC
jgi:hypothetical protein